jgi:hypothetical protein
MRSSAVFGPREWVASCAERVLDVHTPMGLKNALVGPSAYHKVLAATTSFLEVEVSAIMECDCYPALHGRLPLGHA